MTASKQQATSAPRGMGGFEKKGGQVVMGPLQPRPPVQPSTPSAPPK